MQADKRKARVNQKCDEAYEHAQCGKMDKSEMENNEKAVQTIQFFSVSLSQFALCLVRVKTNSVCQ